MDNVAWKEAFGGSDAMRTVLKSALAATALCTSVAHAEVIPQDGFDRTAVDYYIFNQSIAGFLEDLERDTQLRFQVTPNVRGSLTNIALSGDPVDVLNRISATWGLDWYAFNKVIHVSPKSEAGTRVVRLGDLTADDAIAALEESGLPMDKFPARVAGQGSALVFSGPPTLLALAEAVIETIPETPELVGPSLPPGPTVIVRRGITTQVVPIQ